MFRILSSDLAMSLPVKCGATEIRRCRLFSLAANVQKDNILDAEASPLVQAPAIPKFQHALSIYAILICDLG
jgi:hypothetical protein